jgi:hypothetical protein
MFSALFSLKSEKKVEKHGDNCVEKINNIYCRNLERERLRLAFTGKLGKPHIEQRTN